MKNKNYFLKRIDFYGGKITCNNFDIDESIPLEKQESSLSQDMLQVQYGKRFILDVGWYRDSEPDENANLNGKFIIYTIQDQDWENPLSHNWCGTLEELRIALEKAVTFLVAMQKAKGLPYRDIEYESSDCIICKKLTRF